MSSLVDRLLFRRGIAAIDGELQSGQARSHQCETSASIITPPLPIKQKLWNSDFVNSRKTMPLLSLKINYCICSAEQYLGCCIYSRKLLLVVGNCLKIV